MGTVSDAVAGRTISLAAGVALDAAPEQMPHIAAAAGFDAVGIWFDADTWTASTTQHVADALRDAPVDALDVEPIMLGRGDDHGDRIVDIAIELGARFVLVASAADDAVAVARRLSGLAERASGSGVRLALEFLPFFGVATLHDAVAIVESVGSPDVGVLIDTLHLSRSGGTVDDVVAVHAAHPTMLPYLQLADAVEQRPTDTASLVDEALHGRLLPDEGALPIAEVIESVPDVALSIELRSRALMEHYPDPLDRARIVRASLGPPHQ